MVDRLGYPVVRPAGRVLRRWPPHVIADDALAALRDYAAAEHLAAGLGRVRVSDPAAYRRWVRAGRVPAVYRPPAGRRLVAVRLPWVEWHALAAVAGREAGPLSADVRDAIGSAGGPGPTGADAARALAVLAATGAGRTAVATLWRRCGGPAEWSDGQVREAVDRLAAGPLAGPLADPLPRRLAAYLERGMTEADVRQFAGYDDAAAARLAAAASSGAWSRPARFSTKWSAGYRLA